MIPVLSNNQATLIDLLCVENKYISQERLMDNAGMLCAQFFIEKIKNPFNKKVLIIKVNGIRNGSKNESKKNITSNIGAINFV